MKVAVLGVGLIGGSIGLAARRRLEAEVAFEQLLRHRPRLAMAEPEAPPAWRKLINLRGLESLPIACR